MNNLKEISCYTKLDSLYAYVRVSEGCRKRTSQKEGCRIDKEKVKYQTLLEWTLFVNFSQYILFVLLYNIALDNSMSLFRVNAISLVVFFLNLFIQYILLTNKIFQKDNK
uniref:Uncharacterized protein n=1 Tax=Listeria seeligeri TaxID=1640 RepID=A0A7T0Q8F4_LISSE|nr:hypothetical protein pLIS400451c [Listeria seeligeri]